MLHAITDRRIRNMIARRIDGLTKEPAKKGKALVAELIGFRSLRVARYRVLYKVEEGRVIIVAVGIRREGDTKDIYARAKKILKLKLIGNVPKVSGALVLSCNSTLPSLG